MLIAEEFLDGADVGACLESLEGGEDFGGAGSGSVRGSGAAGGSGATGDAATGAAAARGEG
jgi:hypothetical protein